MTDAVISQVEVGTMVKAGDDVDVYAFATVLPLTRAADVPAVRAVVDYMLARCPRKQRGDFEKVLQAPSTGLLLNERMLNMPPEMAPSLHQCLCDDLAWASKEAEPKGAFSFKQLVLLSPRFKMSVVEEESPAAAGSTAPAKRMKGAPSSDLHFYKWEEGLIAEKASLQFTFGIPAATEVAAPQSRTVLVVDTVAYKGVVAQEMVQKLEAVQKAEAEAVKLAAAASAGKGPKPKTGGGAGGGGGGGGGSKGGPLVPMFNQGKKGLGPGKGPK